MWLLFTLPFFHFDQSRVDEFIQYLHQDRPALMEHLTPPVRTGFLPHIPRFKPDEIKTEPGCADIVIGDTPAETLYLTGNFFHEGNIMVINDGVLIIKNADFNLNGDLYVLGGGRVTADSSALKIIQYYIYHHAIVIADSAKFFINDCHTSFNGYQISIAVAGRAELSMSRVENRDWITAGLYEQGRAILDRVGITGEWLFSNSCYACFNRVDYLLSWFFFENGDTVNINFPESDTVRAFYLDSTLPNIKGVDYHVEIDTSSGCMWAAIPLRGSAVIIDSSILRTTGLMFNGGDTFAVTGLVNNQNYSDWVLPVNDRLFRLRNTTIQTWNLYPADSARVNVTSSIFGELCAYDHSFATIQNAFCDGSGGHIEASGHGITFCFLSSLACDVIAKNRGFLILGYTSMTMGNIWATSAAVMIIVNSQFPEDPIPSDTAIVFVAGISGPSSGRVNDTIAIQGSAWIDPGPFNPQNFYFYRLFWRPAGTTTWHALSDSQFIPVRHATLGYWNTVGLTEGPYDLRLVLKDLSGDSIEALKPITLRLLGQDEQSPDIIHETFTVHQSGRVCRIENASRNGTRIYDLTGRLVYHTRLRSFSWTAKRSGIYFLRSADQTFKIIAF